MTRPLITVTNYKEAKTVSEHEVDIVDVKNPEEGSLGCASIETIEGVMEVLQDDIKVSIALGDLPYLPGTVSMAVNGALQLDPDYIKIGLKGAENEEEAKEKLVQASKVLKNSDNDCKLVAAAYADHSQQNSVSPLEAAKAASRADIDGVMIDTLSKEDKDLFDFKTNDEVERFLNEGKKNGLETALAGSIKSQHVEDLKKKRVDIIGVRGAVCSNDRKGRIDRKKLEDFLRRF